MLTTVVSRLAVALLIGAAAAVGVPAAPATAAPCTSATGVTVVVDFNQLDDKVQEICDRDGGGQFAYTLFKEHFALTMVQRQPGFVCRISGKPAAADEPCVDTPPSDAYWALYWSDGKSGRWAYSSAAAGSLRIPDGGYVAFSWKEGSAAAPPSATPTARAASTPTEEPTPDDHGNGNGNGDGNGNGNGKGKGNRDDPDRGKPGSPSPSDPSTSTSASPSASATPTKKAQKAKGPSDGPKPTKSASGSPTPTAAPSDEPSDEAADVVSTASPTDPDDGLPGWVAPGVIAALFAAAVAILLVRRRGTAPRGKHT